MAQLAGRSLLTFGLEPVFQRQCNRFHRSRGDPPDSVGNCEIRSATNTGAGKTAHLTNTSLEHRSSGPNPLDRRGAGHGRSPLSRYSGISPTPAWKFRGPKSRPTESSGIRWNRLEWPGQRDARQLDAPSCSSWAALSLWVLMRLVMCMPHI